MSERLSILDRLRPHRKALGDGTIDRTEYARRVELAYAEDRKQKAGDGSWLDSFADATAWTLSYAKSAASKMIGGPVDRATRQNRNVSCFGVDLSGMVIQPPCERLGQDDRGRYYCSACPCGKREEAVLLDSATSVSKLDYPYLVCPLGKEGFAKDGPRVKGVAP